MAIKFLNDQLFPSDIFLVDVSAGRVGINTLLPRTALEVVGTLRVWSGSNTHTYVETSSGSNLGSIQGKKNSDNAVKALALNPLGGNIGINLGADVLPGRQLTLSGNSSPIISLKSNTTGGEPAVYFGDTDSDVIGRIVYSNSQNFMSFWTAGAQRLRIASDGNVGINTTDPQAKLHVRASTSGVANAQITGDLVVERGSAPSIQIISANTQTQSINFGDPEDGDAGRITYSHASNEMQLWTNATRQVLIDSSGQVGIGTISPDVMLDVSTSTYANAFVPIQDLKYTTFDVMKLGFTGLTGSIRTGTIDTGTYGFAINTGDGTERVRINTSGEVGIGTNDPTSELHIAAASPEIKIEDTSNLSAKVILDGTRLTQINQAGTKFTISDEVLGESFFEYEAASGINVKVGDVGGGVNDTYIEIDDVNSKVLIPNGNVGIGDSTPSSTLSVGGGVQIGNDTATLAADLYNKVGTFRYRTDAGASKNFSYVDMVMQTAGTVGDSGGTYEWVNIVQNSWT